MKVSVESVPDTTNKPDFDGFQGWFKPNIWCHCYKNDP